MTKRRAWILSTAIVGLILFTGIPAAPVTPFGPYVSAWGSGGSGQLGWDKVADSNVPVAVCQVNARAPCSTASDSALSPFGVKAISAGGTHSLALLRTGQVVAWGFDGYGQLGNGTSTSATLCNGLACSITPVYVCKVNVSPPCTTPSKTLSGVKAISAGGNHSLALLNNGTVVSWGYNASGQLGDGTSAGPTTCTGTPSAPNGFCSTTPVYVCMVVAPTPCSKKHLLRNVVAISAGWQHSLALLKTGGVVSWGDNGYGQLGTASSIPDSTTPVAVCAATATAPCVAGGRVLGGVKAISAGGYHSMALQKGTVVTWGDNAHGQLGNGTSVGPDCSGTCNATPGAVIGLRGVTQISGGLNFSLALLGGGTVESWGDNADDQLGDGSSMGPNSCTASGTSCSMTPVPVCSMLLTTTPCSASSNDLLSGVKAVSAGGFQGVALLTTGAVLDWGYNYGGILGTGTSMGPQTCNLVYPCSPLPVGVCQVNATGPCSAGAGNLLFGVIAISAGGYHNLALYESGDASAAPMPSARPTVVAKADS